MKIRKDLIIVALATFCLTSTLFMVVTSKSADSPNWDPWADIKEDGTVDIYDAITLANAFGSSGDTPKNVNVTNWPPSTNANVTNWPSAQNVNVTNWMSPRPKTVLYASYNIVWNSSGLYSAPIVWNSPLYVGDYSCMSILFSASDVNVDNGAAIIGIGVNWQVDAGTTVSGPTVLPKAFIQLGGNMANLAAGIASLSIVAPYIQMNVRLINDWEVVAGVSKGNATLSIYVHLGNEAQQEATATGNEIVYSITDEDSTYLGKYPVQGYKYVTLVIDSSVPVSLIVYGCDFFNTGFVSINVSNYDYHHALTFAVVSPFFYAYTGPASPTPWNGVIHIYYME